MWTAFIDKLAGAKRSATIWFNGITGTVVMGLPMLQDNLPQVREYVPMDYFKWVMGAVIVINILLRFKTTQPLENK